MSNIFLITKREFLTQVRKKSFILMTFFSPILVLLFGFIIGFIFKTNQSNVRVGVIDENNIFHTVLKNTDDLTYVHYANDVFKKLVDSLDESKNLDAILFIPKTKDLEFNSIEKNIQIYSNKNLSKTATKEIENQLEEKIKQTRLEKLGINQEKYDSIKSNISFKEIQVNKGNLKVNQEIDHTIKEVLSYILMYVVFMFIIIYGTRVMRNILEEKNNRVVEIIISSVKPIELMLGKILGTTFVAISQFVVWILMTLGILMILNLVIGSSEITQISQQTNKLPFEINEVSNVVNSLWSLNYPLIIAVFLFYFFIGYFFYSSFFAAIGSAVDSETETSQFTPLVIIPLTLAVYGSISIINNPEGSAAFWLSIVPFTAPVAMVARISFGVPISEILISVTIMIISTLLMVYLASKIYRTGILMYGKKITFKELFKWLKY